LAEKHLYRAAADDLCRIFVTSDGGRLTAIALTHGMIAARLDRQNLLLGPHAPFCHRTYLGLPLRRPLVFQVMLGTLWRGGALVMAWDVQKALAALAAYRVQNVIARPQSLLELAEAADSHRYCSELAAVYSFSDMGQELSDWVRARLCSNLTW